jgi:hypothetical protein
MPWAASTQVLLMEQEGAVLEAAERVWGRLLAAAAPGSLFDERLTAAQLRGLLTLGSTPVRAARARGLT